MANNLTSPAIQSLLNTLDANFDKIKVKGKQYYNTVDFDVFYTPFEIVGTKLSVVSPNLSLNANIVFDVNFPGGTVIDVVLEELEIYANDETTLYISTPLDDTYSFTADGTFTLTDLDITLS